MCVHIGMYDVTAMGKCVCLCVRACVWAYLYMCICRTEGSIGCFLRSQELSFRGRVSHQPIAYLIDYGSCPGYYQTLHLCLQL